MHNKWKWIHSGNNYVLCLQHHYVEKPFSYNWTILKARKHLIITKAVYFYVIKQLANLGGRNESIRAMPILCFPAAPHGLVLSHEMCLEILWRPLVKHRNLVGQRLERMLVLTMGLHSNPLTLNRSRILIYNLFWLVKLMGEHKNYKWLILGL